MSENTANLSLAAIQTLAAERAYQRQKWGDDHDDNHDMADWSAIVFDLASYLAVIAKADETKVLQLQVTVKLMATCFAILESAERRGIPLPVRRVDG